MNRFWTLSLILISIAWVGCTLHDAALPDEEESNQIVNINIENDSDSLKLTIQANQTLNYTEDRMANPNGILFSFLDTRIDGLKGLYKRPDNEVVRYIRVGAHAVNGSPVATIYFALGADTSYGVAQDNSRLRITFPIQPALANQLTLPQ